MTLAPGRKSSGLEAKWERDLDKDLEVLQKKYKTDILVTLMEEWEFKKLKNQALIERCELYQIENIWFPIVDGGVPTDIDKYMDLVKNIKSKLETGKNVVVHCIAGLGRTGTLGAALLIILGVEPEKAITIVRKIRPRTIENKQQENFLFDIKKKLNEIKGKNK